MFTNITYIQKPRKHILNLYVVVVCCCLFLARQSKPHKPQCSLCVSWLYIIQLQMHGSRFKVNLLVTLQHRVTQRNASCSPFMLHKKKTTLFLMSKYSSECKLVRVQADWDVVFDMLENQCLLRVH